MEECTCNIKTNNCPKCNKQEAVLLYVEDKCEDCIVGHQPGGIVSEAQLKTTKQYTDKFNFCPICGREI